MSREDISQAFEDVSVIRGLFITSMPDCLLFDSWMRAGSEWNAEGVASYFGDLARANKEGLKALGSWSAEMQVTIQSADLLIVLREVETDFVIAFVFDRETPLDVVRLQIKRVLEHVGSFLPTVQAKEQPEGVRLVEFLQRYSPDPHAALLRVALQTGIDLEILQRPESLTPEQVEAVKESARDILGLQNLEWV